MVQVIQERRKFESLGEFGTLLGSVLQQQNAKKQQAQAQQNFQNFLPTLDPNKQLSLQDTLRIQQMAQQAGYDPKAVMEAIKQTKPSNLERILAGSEYQNQKMDINPFEAPVSNSAKPLVEATYQNLAPRPTSPIENLTDRQILALSSSPNPEDRAFADMAVKQKEARRKDYIDNRDYHSKVSDKYAENINVEREAFNGLNSSIKDFEYALEAGDIGPYSKDFFGKMLGRWFSNLTTPEGALANRASKEFLLADTSRIAARGLNVFMEQRLASTYPEIGKTKEANATLIAGIKMKARNMEAKIKAYDELSTFYEQKLGYVPRNINRLVEESIKDEIEKNAYEAAREMRQIQESTLSDADLKKNINKKLAPGTPITDRTAQLFLNKFGKDAEKRAKERGFSTELPDGTSVFSTLVLGDSPTPKKGEITNSQIIEQFGLEKRSIPQDVGVEFTEEAELPQIVKGVGQGIADIGLQASMAPSLIQSLASSGLSPEARSQVATPGQITEAKRMTEPVSEAEFIRRASEGEDILPPVYTPGARSLLEETLSAPRGGLLEESTRRATRNLPYLAGGPGTYAATAGRDILGQFAAEGAQAIGFGETGQNVADILTGFIPSKTFIPRKQDAERLKFLQEAEFTPEQISLILRKGSTGGDLPLKFAEKGGKTQKTIESAKEKFNDVFESLRKEPGAEKMMTNRRVNKFTQSIEDLLKKTPVDIEKAIREDYSKFLESPQTGNDLINFYRAINKKVGNKKQLVALKPLIKKELQQLDGQLAKNFELSNDLYAKFSDVASKLDPTWFSTIKEQSLPWRIFGGLLSLPFEGGFILTEAIGEAALTKLMSAMVTNPRYQNLIQKTVASINSGNIKGVEKLANQILSELAKDAPEAYEAMSGINQNSLQL